MKKILVFLTLFFGVLSTTARDSKVSATLSYPVTVGDNFLNEYTGFVDLGLQYRFVNFGIVNLGVAANAGFFAISNPPNAGEKFTAMLIQPKIFSEFLLSSRGQLRPSLGIGYGYNKLNNRADTTGGGLSDIKRVYEGAVINLGLAYHVSEGIFIQAQYDRSKINRSFDAFGDKNFISRGTLIKIG